MTPDPSWAEVAALGARCPLGLSSLQVAMCARAGRKEPRPTPFRDARGHPIGMGLVGGLPRELWGPERLLGLSLPALAEAWPSATSAPIPLVLALPEARRPDDSPALGMDFIGALAARSRLPIDLQRSAVVRAGHAGGAMAFELALGLLAREAEAAMVGGVDSYYHPDVLRWLDEGYRLHAPEVENGFVPSEGAAFVLLRRQAPEGRAKGPAAAPLATLAAVRTADERALLDDAPNLAQAMTGMMRELASAFGPAEWVLSDLNGEHHRQREWSMVCARELVSDDAVHHQAGDDLGDVGAASGAMLVSIAAEFFAAGCAPSPRATIALQSEGPERGVIVIGRPS